MLNICLISLGCEKNLVDSEWVLGMMPEGVCSITSDASDADGIIINTCGFITSAKEEAINTIYESLELKKDGAKVIVIGCLVERYYKELKEGIKDVDLWVPIRDYNKLGDLLCDLFNVNEFKGRTLCYKNRVISTPKHLAYVKISEGCNNKCTYCAIPLIRGSFRSRSVLEVLDEVKYLVRTGRKEICLISQDLTRYGSDIGYSLDKLLVDICNIEGDFKVRMLYLYPDEITKELIEVVKNNSKVLPYFDIPIQHASNKILNLMNRRGQKDDIRNLVNYIRNEIPECVIRTTLIVGFPYETTKDFEELVSFVSEMKFDHLGCFTYCKEEDTESFNFKGQVSEKIKKKRYDKIMDLQKFISLKNNEKYLNKEYDCVIEEYNEDGNYYVARSYHYAPDDIDGCLIVYSDRELEIGNFYKVKIDDTDFYDMIGHII